MPAAFDRATIPYLLAALAWGLALVLSFAGWGSGLLRVLRQKNADGGLKAALGLSLTVAAGGIGSLAGVLSRTGAMLWVAAGIGLAALALLRGTGVSPPGGPAPPLRRDGAPVFATWGVAALALLALLHLAGSVHGRVWDGSGFRDFDPHDDEQAYLAFSEKMLETGGLGADPFDARRLVVPGGQWALQALVVSLLPARATHLLDAGVGLLLSLWVLAGAVRSAALPRGFAALPPLFLLLLPSLMARGNTTALFTGVALLLALYRLADESPFSGDGLWRAALQSGLVLSALVSLKSTFLPAAVLFLALLVLFSPSRERGKRLREGAAAGGFAALFLLPWMVSLKLSSGTFFFPLLGKGNQLVAWNRVEGLPPPPSRGERAALALTSLRAAVPIALLLPLAFFRSRRAAVLAVGLSALILPVLYRLMGDPFLDRSLSRYFFPAFVWATSLLLVAALRVREGESPRARLAGVAALAVAAGILARDARDVRGQLRQLAVNLRAAVSGGDLFDRAVAGRTRALLEPVPRGEAVLARLRLPHFLDFRKHRILLLSMPGMSSPPPGMPFFEGPEKVAEYLGGQEVRYLAYGSRSDEGELLKLSEDDIRYRYPRSRSRWAILAFHRDFHRNVRELSFTRRRLADEPDGVVLDLASRALRLPVLEAPERCEGFTPDGWTVGRPARVRMSYERSEADRFLRLEFSGASSVKDLPGRHVKASVDGVDLPVVLRGPAAIVFDLGPAPRRLESLVLESPATDLGDYGAEPATMLGADVLGIAVLGRPDEEPSLGPEPQRVEGPLEVSRAEWRSGFTPDGWTNGDGLLENLLWEVKPGQGVLAVELGAGPPGPPETADVRLVVNGVRLRRIGVKDGVWSFRLLPGQPPIRRIRILSTTFVPKEAGLNDDGRRLGVAVARVSVR